MLVLIYYSCFWFLSSCEDNSSSELSVKGSGQGYCPFGVIVMVWVLGIRNLTVSVTSH